MLAVLTGPVRSGKSRLAVDLALSTGRSVVLAAAGLATDDEMTRRIARHQAERPSDVNVLEIDDPDRWLDRVEDSACLIVDCLGTLVSRLMDDTGLLHEVPAGDAEAKLEERVNALIDALLARGGRTIVVTNEVGWGVVPVASSGRVFRDVIGRANARLVDAADAAWLVVCGRTIDLRTHAKEVSWT